MFENAVGYGDVLESSTRFCTQFDTSCMVAMVRRLRLIQFPSTAEHGSTIVSADKTIRNCYVFRIFKVS